MAPKTHTRRCNHECPCYRAGWAASDPYKGRGRGHHETGKKTPGEAERGDRALRVQHIRYNWHRSMGHPLGCRCGPCIYVKQVTEAELKEVIGEGS